MEEIQIFINPVMDIQLYIFHGYSNIFFDK